MSVAIFSSLVAHPKPLLPIDPVACTKFKQDSVRRILEVKSSAVLVQVYDLRMMKPAAPLQPKFDPRFLRFIPSFTTKLLICSSSGDLVIVEPSDIIPPTAQYYKMDGAGGTFTSVALSSYTHSYYPAVAASKSIWQT